MALKAIARLVAHSLFLIPFLNHAAVLDFENLANGTIIDDEYLVSYGVSVSAQNFSSGPDLAVIFDSTPDGRSTNFRADPDLIGNFDNIAPDVHNQNLPDNYDPGNILILQENQRGCNGSTCRRPDDEGSRTAGVLSFNFLNPIRLISLDFFDVELAENGATTDNRIDVWDFETGLISTIGHTPNTGGDNLWAQMLFDSTDPALINIGRVDVYMGGSGAIDNLHFSVVPIPSSIWLFGAALLGFIGLSRRTKI